MVRGAWRGQRALSHSGGAWEHACIRLEGRLSAALPMSPSLAASVHFLKDLLIIGSGGLPRPPTRRNWAPSPSGVDLGNGWAACLPFFSHRKKCLEITLGWGLLTGGAAGRLLLESVVSCWPSAALPSPLPSSRCHQLGRHRACRRPWGA